jgi:hypothetical protein
MAISDKKNNFLIDHQTLKIMKFNIGIIMSWFVYPALLTAHEKEIRRILDPLKVLIIEIYYNREKEEINFDAVTKGKLKWAI